MKTEIVKIVKTGGQGGSVASYLVLIGSHQSTLPGYLKVWWVSRITDRNGDFYLCCASKKFHIFRSSLNNL